jgi:hypothetical protein
MPRVGVLLETVHEAVNLSIPQDWILETEPKLEGRSSMLEVKQIIKRDRYVLEDAP